MPGLTKPRLALLASCTDSISASSWSKSLIEGCRGRCTGKRGRRVSASAQTLPSTSCRPVYWHPGSNLWRLGASAAAMSHVVPSTSDLASEAGGQVRGTGCPLSNSGVFRSCDWRGVVLEFARRPVPLTSSRRRTVPPLEAGGARLLAKAIRAAVPAVGCSEYAGHEERRCKRAAPGLAKGLSADKAYVAAGYKPHRGNVFPFELK